MSCEIRTFGKIEILEIVRQFFGLCNEDNWLNLCCVSHSPSKEILTLGYGNQFIILGFRYVESSSEQIINYTINWKGHLENENEAITSILCLPIIGQLSPQEWTCIAIGLTSGLVLFYCDSGQQIFSQQWHNNGESVLELRAQSGKKIPEEFYITFSSCICIVQGSHLFDVLKNMKQYYFKVHNNSNKFDISPTSERIPCKKWAYGVKHNMRINDSIVIGSEKSLTFDHLLTASLEGGFFAKYKSAPPQNYLVLGIGMNPFLGFHYGKDGFIQPVLADVARAVASKLKSALPNWLTGTSSSVSDAEIATPLSPSEPMICRFGICDQQRNAMSVWLAPGNKIAAVSDNLGRIILVDCVKGIAIRVWKGYREAQCSFIEVIEKVAKKNNDESERRKAIFLVIFAPRRSCLEIWPLQRGDKIAAFNASKYGKLLYTSYSFMGVTSANKPKYTTNTCLFFDPTDLSIKEILIPFHCALTDSNSKTAKDLHLLRRCKMLLRSSDDGTEEEIISEISTTCKNFETNEIRIQCLEMLVKNKKITPVTLKIALDVLMQCSDECENEESNELLDYHRKILRTLCTNYIKLIDFYLYVTTISDCFKEGNEINKMNISTSELINIQQLLDLSTLEGSNSLTGPRVKFSDLNENSTNFIDYLSAFNVQKTVINLHEDKVNLFFSVGQLIYQKFFEKKKNFENFCEFATNSGIIIEDFMKLLLFYWLEKPFCYSTSDELIEDMSRFSLILHNICSLAGDKVKFEYTTISNWWQTYREILLESECALRGLLAAIICRDQAVKFGITEVKEEIGLNNHWETVSQEKCEWTLLISKLDDVAVLGAILSVPIKFENMALPILKYEKPNISLKEILRGGKGIISEMVSKWISAIGISPEKLLENDFVGTSSNDKKIKNLENYPLTSDEFLKNIDKTISCTALENLSDFDPRLHNLNILRQHFPFSLKSSVLLCHLTWEYMCFWSKNLSKLEYLKAGLNCLEVFKKQDFGIKHGLCCMLWNAHFKIPLEATKKLLNKAGRLPKEKLCLQDIGLSDHDTPLFLEYSQSFLKHFSTSLEHEKIDLKYEELLQDGLIPLALLTLEQNLANPILLKLHIELVEILHMIAFFNIKYQKPIQNLFNTMSNQAFFTEINKNLNYVIPEPDLILEKIRYQFLEKLITASIDLIREDFEKNVFLNDHIFWIEKIENFAEKWKMDLMALKRHQIIELYSHNYDIYAEELLETIIETQEFGSLLLKIAGHRLNILTKNSPSKWATVAAIGPLLNDYLDNLNMSDSNLNQIQNDISLEALLKLSGKAFSCLSGKDTKELRIAGQLFDACATVKDM